MQDRLADLPAAQAEALAAALGWGPAETPGDRFLVAAATLSLLAAAAERAPVLVLVDDLHWVDQESAAALLFAARRLQPRRRGVPVRRAHRFGPRGAARRGCPVLALAGLAPAEAAGLLPGSPADPVAARLVEGTRGNPLALWRWPASSPRPSGSAPRPFPDPLPVGARLELVYEPLLAGLSAPAWRAVLLCAAGPAGRRRAGWSARWTATASTPAPPSTRRRSAGSLVRDGGGCDFRHPLLRSAALAAGHPGPAPGGPPRPGRRPARGGRPDGPHLAPGRGGRRHPTTPSPASWSAVAERGPHPAGFRRRLGRPGARRPAHHRPRPGRRAAGRRRRATRSWPGTSSGPGRWRPGCWTGPPAAAAPRPGALTLGMLEQYAGSVPRAAELLAAAAELADGAAAGLGAGRAGHCPVPAQRPGRRRRVRGPDRRGRRPARPRPRALAAFTRGVALIGRWRPGRRAARCWPTSWSCCSRRRLRDDPRYLIHLALAAGFLGDLRGLRGRRSTAPGARYASAARSACWSRAWR